MKKILAAYRLYQKPSIYGSSLPFIGLSFYIGMNAYTLGYLQTLNVLIGANFTIHYLLSAKAIEENLGSIGQEPYLKPVDKVLAALPLGIGLCSQYILIPSVAFYAVAPYFVHKDFQKTLSRFNKKPKSVKEEEWDAVEASTRELVFGNCILYFAVILSYMLNIYFWTVLNTKHRRYREKANTRNPNYGVVKVQN